MMHEVKFFKVCTVLPSTIKIQGSGLITLGGCKLASKRLQAAVYSAHEAFSSLVKLVEVPKVRRRRP